MNSRTLRTQVGIVGAGPAGLLLAHLLYLEGVDSVVLESRSRAYAESRVRAGVLEQSTVEVLGRSGVAERLLREGLRHEGVILRFAGHSHRLDFPALTGGRAITVYGQQEVVKDLIGARLEAGAPLFFEAEALALEGLEGKPSVVFEHQGVTKTLHCDVIAGCDGFHGVCRAVVAPALTVYERRYPFAWLGILAQAPPSSQELIYSNHARGFALHSMRSPQVSRNYLQCAPDENLADWPDARIWDELQTRLDAEGFALTPGPILDKGVTGMRAFVAEPMQAGKLFLAGDAAHIVPPTGAKGMNLAVADVCVLAEALSEFYASGDKLALERYSERCLGRVWQAQHFSWWMTTMLHAAPDDDAYGRRLQLAQLEALVTVPSAAETFARRYVG